jgi:transposase
MGQVFYPYEPDQALLFPPSLRDWLPDGHLAHFLSDTVDQLDLTAFYTRYEQRADGRGQLAYEPRLMLKLLFYAYAVGLFSSRKIAQALEELVPLRYLAAGNTPRHAGALSPGARRGVSGAVRASGADRAGGGPGGDGNAGHRWVEAEGRRQ